MREITLEQALKWLYAGHLYDEREDLEHGISGDSQNCGFCSVIRDSIGTSIFEDLSLDELTEGIHPLMHYLLENGSREPSKPKEAEDG